MNKTHDERVARTFVLSRRPDGEPTLSDFELVEQPLPPLDDGEILVHNEWISVDPYMRRRMNLGASYVAPFELNEPMEGSAIGVVEESRDPRRPVGMRVEHSLGWRDRGVLAGRFSRPVDDELAPVASFLGVLGMPGLTAYVGLKLADLQPGETIFISAAAGAVGSVAGQIAKLRGARVIGSAGSDEKVRWLTEELGFDAAFNYKSGAVVDLLGEAAATGIDAYFDNVGYDHLEAALECANYGARFAMCGTVADYNAPTPLPGPSNLFRIVGKRLVLRGFIVTDHLSERKEFEREVAPWVKGGLIQYHETVRNGLEAAPTAFIDLLRGQSAGKMLVSLAS